MLHLISALVLCLIIGGLLSRRTPQIHLRFMVTAFLIDLGLVIYIEVTREAVEKVVSQINPLVWFHALVSVLVLFAYVVQIILGRRLLAGKISNRKLHIMVGITFCALRLLNYITSFWVIA